MTLTAWMRRSRATAMGLAVLGVATLLALGGALAACGGEEPAAPTGDPSITGVVATAGPVDPATPTVAWFRIDEGAGDYDKASVTVTGDTAWYRRDGDGFKAIAAPSAGDLTGKTVEVQFTGAVAESYPVQATAGWVLVED